MPTPFSLTPPAPGDYGLPFAEATPIPTEALPTPKLPPTALPPATPFIPLEALRKTPTPATVALGHGLSLPPGFKVGVYAQGLESVSYLTYSSDGVLFASLPGRGAVVAMSDSPDHSQPSQMIVFAQGLAIPTGLAFRDNYLYVAEANRVVRFPYTPGQLSAPGGPEVVLPDLPAGGSMTTRPIGFGPDDRLYLAISASCNACREVDYRRATIMRYDVDGSHEEIFAQGLRDVEDFIWYPNTYQFLATNCSRRRMGEDMPPDSIEYVYAGANFGWPFCHAGDISDPELGWPAACEGVPTPFQQLPAHTTPRGLCVNAGRQFPPEYYGDIFVALHGSWERQVPVGYKIVRLDVEEGRVVASEDFTSGWLVHGAAWGRPVDLIQASDGSLLVSDDRAGAIYRIYYQG